MNINIYSCKLIEKDMGMHEKQIFINYLVCSLLHTHRFWFLYELVFLSYIT